MAIKSPVQVQFRSACPCQSISKVTTQNIPSLTLASHFIDSPLFRFRSLRPTKNTTHTRLSRYVSGTEPSGGGVGGGRSGTSFQASFRNSRTPSFQSDARQKLNSSSRKPSTAACTTAALVDSGSKYSDPNRTPSISEKRPSINGTEGNNCLTISNRGDARYRKHSGCSLVR